MHHLSKLPKLQNQRVARLQMETNSPFCNPQCEALLLDVMESVKAFKFFKIIYMARKYFIGPIFFLENMLWNCATFGTLCSN